MASQNPPSELIERTLFSTLTSLGEVDKQCITRFFRNLTPMEQTFVRMIFEEGYEQGTDDAVDSATRRPWPFLLEQQPGRN